jgi:hypothetical protein
MRRLFTMAILILSLQAFAQNTTKKTSWYLDDGILTASMKIINGERVYDGAFSFKSDGSGTTLITGNYTNNKFNGPFSFSRVGKTIGGYTNASAKGSFKNGKLDGLWTLKEEKLSFNIVFKNGKIVTLDRVNGNKGSTVKQSVDEYNLLHGREIWKYKDNYGVTVQEDNLWVHGILVSQEKKDAQTGENLGKKVLLADTSIFNNRNFNPATLSFFYVYGPDSLEIKPELVNCEHSDYENNWNGSDNLMITLKFLMTSFDNPCKFKLRPVEQKNISDIDNFKNAQIAIKNENWLQAYTLLSDINILSITVAERQLLLSKLSELKPIVAELISRYTSNSAFYKDYITAKTDSLMIDFNTTKQNFKRRSVTKYNQYTYKYEETEPEVISYQCNCLQPWNESDIECAIKCFNKNPKYYEPYQKVITENFFNYCKVLNDEDLAIKNSAKNITFNQSQKSFYAYDKEVFIDRINAANENYQKSKLIMKQALEFEKNEKQIEQLNGQNKKKILLEKFTLVLNDYKTKYQSYKNLDDCLSNLYQANLFLEKVISLYIKDTKELEKELKSIDSIDQIKSLILAN